jgi:hypothetical protein
MNRWIERTAALVCVLACVCTGILPAFVLPFVRSDARGAIVERRFDTNGDGRPDVVEYYRNGALLRRVSDRNFNGVTDLVEDFDAVTQQRVRSIVDQDYDGTADVLLLYRDGEPVVSERASSPETEHARTQVRRDSTVLVSLRNPFSNRRAFESFALGVPRDAWIGPTAAGLTVSAARLPAPAASLTSLPRAIAPALNADRSLRSPRGPPLA